MTKVVRVINSAFEGGRCSLKEPAGFRQVIAAAADTIEDAEEFLDSGDE